MLCTLLFCCIIVLGMTLSEIPTAPVLQGAFEVGEWGRDTPGDWSRWLLWSSHHGGEVQVDGRQRADGTASGAVTLWTGNGEQLSAVEARQLAAALLDAANAVDGLSIRTPNHGAGH